jgi:hypothetical protein
MYEFEGKAVARGEKRIRIAKWKDEDAKWNYESLRAKWQAEDAKLKDDAGGPTKPVSLVHPDRK